MFPALVALGIPPVVANLTSSVALCPGYLGGTLAQRSDLAGQGRRALLVLPLAMLGAAAGALLLLHSSEQLFTAIVPGLILLACALLAAQPAVRRWMDRRADPGTANATWVALPVGFAAVYGGYFGAGLGVMMLAVLALAIADTLTRLNALKQLLSLVINVTAALVFIRSGEVLWPVAGAVAVGALAGGSFGGRFAGRISPGRLRSLVIGLGIVAAIGFWVKT